MKNSLNYGIKGCNVFSWLLRQWRILSGECLDCGIQLKAISTTPGYHERTATTKLCCPECKQVFYRDIRGY